MKLLILGNTNGTPTERSRQYYQEYVDFFVSSATAIDESTVVRATLVDDLAISVGDGNFSIFDTLHGVDIAEYDVIFVRADQLRKYMGTIVTVNEYAALHGIEVINDYRNARDSSKLLQAVQFEKLNIPVARTLLVTGGLLRNMPTDWEFPCIMKATHGSHGNDNHLVRDVKEVEAIATEASDKLFVLQRFVPNDGDFRVLIIGDEVMVIGRKAVDGSHLNNTSQGGDAIVLPTDTLPEKVIADAKKIMHELRMTIAGVDVLMDKETGEYYFLEVNAQPQLMSGAAIPEKRLMMGKLLDSLHNKR